MRINQANVHGTLNGAITSGATSITVAFDAGSATQQALAAHDFFVVVIEPDTANEEVIWVLGPLGAGATAWTTVRRGQEGVSVGLSHANGAAWKHGPTVVEFSSRQPNMLITVPAAPPTLDVPPNTQVFARRQVIDPAGELVIPPDSELIFI